MTFRVEHESGVFHDLDTGFYYVPLDGGGWAVWIETPNSPVVGRWEMCLAPEWMKERKQTNTWWEWDSEEADPNAFRPAASITWDSSRVGEWTRLAPVIAPVVRESEGATFPKEIWENVVVDSPLSDNEELSRWWRERSEVLLAQTLERSNGYSAVDLGMLGDVLIASGVKLPEEMNKDELGCWFYLWGKMARGLGAVQEGRMPSDDTVHDIEVYSVMIDRIRSVGGWPWAK